MSARARISGQPRTEIYPRFNCNPRLKRQTFRNTSCVLFSLVLNKMQKWQNDTGNTKSKSLLFRWRIQRPCWLTKILGCSDQHRNGKTLSNGKPKDLKIPYGKNKQKLQGALNSIEEHKRKSISKIRKPNLSKKVYFIKHNHITSCLR